MAKINTTNYQPVTSWNGTQDLLIVEQPDGTKVATPEQVKQFMDAFMDDEPTEGSEEAVKSGGVFNAIEDSLSLKSTTGNPITLTDAANANAEELSMSIEPIQSGSGDPSPTNVRPISGLTEGKVFDYGENLVDITRLTSHRQEQGITFTLNGDGSVTANGTATGRCQIYWVIPNNLATEFAGKILCGNPSINNCSLILELDGSPFTAYATDNGEGSTISNDIASAPTGTGVSLIWRIQSGVTLDHVTITPRITNTATNATITFGQTVYGGSVNFKTGEVTVTHGIVDLGTVNWTKTGDSGITYFYTSLPSNPKTTNPQHICSNYVRVGTYAQLLQTNNSFFQNHNKALILRDDSLANVDAATFKTAMSGVQLCYELATPTTLTLTPAELELLRGGNIITGNGAEVSIEYYPDNAVGALARRVDGLTTPTLIWNGYATDVGSTYSMTRNYTDFKYLLVTAKTNYEEKNILIPTSSISATDIYGDVLSTGEWNANTNAFTYNSSYGIKFTAANAFQLVSSYYNNANWVLRPIAIYGIG